MVRDTRSAGSTLASEATQEQKGVRVRDTSETSVTQGGVSFDTRALADRNKSNRKHFPHKKQASYSRTKSKQRGNSPHGKMGAKGLIAIVVSSQTKDLNRDPELQSDSQMYECYVCEQDTRYQLKCKVCE